MKIRKEQLRILSEHRVDDFVRRMARHVTEDLPRQCEAQSLTEADADSFVRRGIAAARDHDITTEVGVRQYIDCMVTLGPEFDSDARYPWAQEILSDDGLSPAEKADALAWRKLSEIDWEELEDA